MNQVADVTLTRTFCHHILFTLFAVVAYVYHMYYPKRRG